MNIKRLPDLLPRNVCSVAERCVSGHHCREQCARLENRLSILHTAGNKRPFQLIWHLTTAFFVFLSIGAHAQGLSVSGSGTPSYTIPIGVPPGIGGMTPNIGLLYSASGVNGPVGHGWSVQGISLITRCAGNKRTDGVARSVEYSVNDKLCLDGQRLIQTDTAGTPLASQQGDSMGGSGMVREYRTDKDIYARIRAYGSSGDASNGPSYFKVWTKSGQIYEYGDMVGKAAINVTGKGLITAWAVRMEERNDKGRRQESLPGRVFISVFQFLC